MSKKTLPIKTVYYHDPLRDEFSGVTRKPKVIDEHYRYSHRSPLWRLASVIVHRGFVTPAAYLYAKICFHLRIYNRALLRPYRKTGYFFYGNHTQVPGDGFFQALVAFPKKSYVLVNSDNVALKGTENLMLMIGAMPLPTTANGFRPFYAALESRLTQGHPIAVFPEAHIWPYYTGIRPFPATSFAFPVRYDRPCFAFTTVYKKRRFGCKPRAEIYIDGPFLPRPDLRPKAAAAQLREQVMSVMQVRAAQSEVAYIRYTPYEDEENQA